MDKDLRDIQNRRYTIANPTTRPLTKGVVIAAVVATIAALVVGVASASLLLDQPSNYYMSESYLATRDAQLVDNLIDSAFPPTITPTATATATVGPTPTITPTPLPLCADVNTTEGTTCVMYAGDKSRTPTPYPTLTPAVCPEFYPASTNQGNEPDNRGLVCIKPGPVEDIPYFVTTTIVPTQSADTIVSVPTSAPPPTVEGIP